MEGKTVLSTHDGDGFAGAINGYAYAHLVNYEGDKLTITPAPAVGPKDPKRYT